MDFQLILIGIGVSVVIAGILGFVLGMADKFFAVEVDPKIEKINQLLPQINCGACGYPGCQGLAEALASGQQKGVNCTPIKKEKRAELEAFLKENNLL